MLVSYNRLKELAGFNISPEELGELLTLLGMEVEEIVDYSKKYDKFYTAEVLTCERHPNADKLSVCTVSLGDTVFPVVCGAPNVAQGQKVVLGTSGATVPSAGFKLEKRKIRGEISDGMICSQAELETGEDTSGIWVLPEDTKPGIPLSEYLDLNDSVIELSITPNNADCLSHYGVAREIGAYFGKIVKYPEININEASNKIDEIASVEIESPEKCPRYTARVIKNAQIGESPDWLKNYLIKIGLRPINLAADVTNYVMMEIGQPMHAFDLDKLSGNKIIVKTAINGDKFKSLDGKERTLNDDMLMICDAEKPVAIAGVMGGENTEITFETTNILLESAYFDPSTVRKTSKKLGLLSDSSYRFERGVDPDNVPFALDLAAKLIAEYGGGEIASGIIDVYPNKINRGNVEIRYSRVKDIIGIEISKDRIIEILTNLHFEKISGSDTTSTWKIPSFRVDVSLEIDLIEDIARHYNYSNIEPQFDSVLNFGKTTVPAKLAMPKLRKMLRDYLVSRGFNEILTQNIIEPKSAALFSENPVKISNPLGEEMSVMRPSVIPSFLKVILNNIRVGTHDLAFFEFGKTFNYTSDDDVFVSGFKETENLTIAITGNKSPEQWGVKSEKADFFDIKGIAEELFEFIRAENVNFEVSGSPIQGFSPNVMIIKSGKDEIGVFGEINTKTLKLYDIEQPVLMLIINAEKLYSLELSSSIYQKVSQFPGMTRDLAFVVDDSTPAEEILSAIKSNGNELLKTVNLFDNYTGKGIEEGKKSLAYSLYFSSNERTLVESEIEQIINKIIKQVKTKFNAQIRS